MQNFGPHPDFELCPGTLDWCMVDGADHTVMKCRQVIQAFQGEWWLDPTIGMPYHQSILGQRPPDIEGLRAIYVAKLTQVPGVKKVLSLSVAFNNADRELQITFSVLDETGVEVGDTVVL